MIATAPPSFFACISPTQIADLMRPIPWKELWRQYMHEIRWERRYDRPYLHSKGELGVWQGIRFVHDST